MLAVPDGGTLMRTDRIRCDFPLIEPAHQTLQFHTDDFGNRCAAGRGPGGAARTQRRPARRDRPGRLVATWGHLAERALRSLLPAASDPEARASRPEARRLSAA